MQLPVRGLEESTIAAPSWIGHSFRQHFDAVQSRKVLSGAPDASRWSLSISKRIMDVVISSVALSFLSVPILIIAICVRLTSKGPAFFVQHRVGRGGRLFEIYKFRSMSDDSPKGIGLTQGGDPRVTRLGQWLRRFKLDELPQFYNILRGEMSLVGPRPKLPFYEPIVNMPVRPGITGAATLAFRREEEILSSVHQSQLEFFYNKEIKPIKACLDLHYMGKATFWSDLRMIAATAMACLTPAEFSLPSFRRAPTDESTSMNT